MGLVTSSASTRSSASRSGRRAAESGAMCWRIRRAASVGVSMSGWKNLGPVPREVGDRHEPGGVREAEHRKVGMILRIVRHHGDPVSRVMDRWVEQRLGPRRQTIHLDLGQGRALEALDQDDLGSLEIAASQGDRVGLVLGPLPQYALPGPLHEDAVGAALVPVAPGVLPALVRIGGEGVGPDLVSANIPPYLPCLVRATVSLIVGT